MRLITVGQYFSSLFLLAILSILTAGEVFAGFVTFEKNYTYQAGESDSKLSCRTIALEQVKRLLLEELGTYLEEKTEVKDFQLVKDQITILTAGVVSAEIIEERWDGKTYYLNAKISADPVDVARKIDSLRKNDTRIKELEEARRKSDELLKELERLKSELSALKDSKRKQKQSEINAIINGLNARDWSEKATALLESGNNKAALDALNKAVTLVPADARLVAYRGYVHTQMGDSKAALIDYGKAITLQHDFYEAYYYRGQLYLTLGYRKAVADYYVSSNYDEIMRRTSRGDPVNLPLDKSPDYQRGLQDLDKALEINPQYEEASLLRGSAFLSRGQYQRSILDFDRIIARNPQSLLAYLYRGNAYAELGNHDQALKDYDRVINIDPQYAKGYYYRSRLPRTPDQRILDLKKAIDLEPNNADYYFALGLTYGYLNKNADKVAAWKIAARLGHSFAQQALKSEKIDW